MISLLVLVFIPNLTFSQSQSTIEYYVNLMNKAYENGQTYEFSKNASKYFADTKIKKYGCFDFVVIGGGTGGSVSASRLSEINKWDVLVLEAGTYGNNLTDIPGAYTPIYFTKYNWGYNSTPQTTACLGMENQVCHFPRGRGLGGSSLINGMVQARGYKYDFDLWAKIAGNDRWAYETALNYMKKSENFVHNDLAAPFDPAYHGESGELRVEYHLPRHPLLNRFLRANQEIGYDVVDYNADKIGASPAQQYTKNGHRVDDYEAFLSPVRHRKNLKILTESYVTKIRIDKKTRRAVGVEFSSNGTDYYVEAKKEVILSAGALISPQILMLSGIGPKEHLRSLGIEVIQDLAVGDNLRDNAAFYGLSFSSNYTEPNSTLHNQVEHFLREGEGPLTTAGTVGLGFYPSSRTKGTNIPEIELEFIAPPALNSLSQRYFSMTDQTYEDLWKFNNVSHTFLFHINDMHARSCGTVRLKSSNPYDYPLIDPRWLSDHDDVDITTMYEGIQLVLNLTKTEAFRAVDAKLQTRPLKACRRYEYLSKEYWFCVLRQVSINLYHPSGTCSMGTDPRKGAVVDWELKVFGIKNLRVADISVMPFSLAGHTHAATVMVGEQLGDLVKMSYSRDFQQ